jgi:hypothetical protein
VTTLGYRWVPFTPSGVLHVLTSWKSGRMAEQRYEALCGKPDDSPFQVEPNGAIRCITCQQLLKRLKDADQ